MKSEVSPVESCLRQGSYAAFNRASRGLRWGQCFISWFHCRGWTSWAISARDRMCVQCLSRQRGPCRE